MSRINIVLLHSSNLNSIKSYGPKCLYKIGKSTVIDRQIENLIKMFKNPNIIIIAGFKYKKIRNHVKQYSNIKVIENPLFETSNDLYAINLALKSLKDNVLIIENNTLIKQNTLQKIDRTKSQLFISLTQKFELGCIIDNLGNINNISWGLPNYWTNISYFQNKEFGLLKQVAASELTNKWFLVEAINWIIKNNGNLSTKEIKVPIKILDKINV